MPGFPLRGAAARRVSLLVVPARSSSLARLLCFSRAPPRAQSTYGAVVGVVTDSSKAVMPGATVTLREVQTNVVRTTTTGARGNYEFLNLAQGRYQVEVEMTRASAR